MRVLTIISKLEMGGIEKTLLSCIPYLKKQGVEMSILCTLGGVLDCEYRNLGVQLIDFGKHKKPFKDAAFLKTLLHENRFDVVHSRYGHTSGDFAKVCADLRIPFIVSIHNEKAMFRNSWERKPVLKFIRNAYLNYHKKATVKYATRVVGHSKANLLYYGINDVNITQSQKFTLLYNGVDFSKFNDYEPLPEEKQRALDCLRHRSAKVLVHIGSFKEQKNHMFLIEVFNKLDPVSNRYALILMGVGELQQEVYQKVRSLGLENQVLFTGMESNIVPYLHSADLFVFPSLYEGFGNVLIEAQYARLPVAASSIAPHYEAVHKDYHEYMYSPFDREEAAEKLNKLLEQSDMLEKEQAFEFAKHFSVENMAQNLVSIYRNVI